MLCVGFWNSDHSSFKTVALALLKKIQDVESGYFSQPVGLFWSCSMCSRTQLLKTPVYYDVLWLCRLPGLSLVVLLRLCHVVIWGSAVIWGLTGQTFSSSLTEWESDADCFLGILMSCWAECLHGSLSSSMHGSWVLRGSWETAYN